MMGFYLYATGLVLLAIVVLVWPLYRHQSLAKIDRRQQNIDIARERLAELQAERANGKLSEAEFAQQRNELEATVLDDALVEEAETTARTVARHGPQQMLGTLLIALLLPAAAGFLYLVLGTPQAIDGMANAQMAQRPGPEKIQEMVVQLAAKLDKSPGDANGWFMLARSYMVLQQYPQALKALQHVRDLEGDKPAVLVSYADALAMTRGGDLGGEVLGMLKQVLKLDPNNIEGLWLSGMAARQRGDAKTALQFWRRALPLMQSDAQAVAQLQDLIRQTEQGAKAPANGSDPAVAAVSKARIVVQVSLAEKLLDQASPEDTVFIYARALQGPPLPLAIVRKKVSDLPLRITLDDSMAMVASASLSKYPQVRLTARITLSGQAKPASGDLIGEVSPVTVNQEKPVNIVIASVVP